jgi:primosomal protein N' (replication factor Y) (superfamily II helicase)
VVGRRRIQTDYNSSFHRRQLFDFLASVAMGPEFVQTSAPKKSEPAELVDVAVALPLHGRFTYRVPPEFLPQVAAGTRVLVPFGRRRVTGYVLGRGEAPPDTPIKSIAAVLDPAPMFPASMLPFFQWVADYYIHPLGEVLQSALPAGINVADQTRFSLTDQGRRALTQAALCAWETAVVRRIDQGPCRLPVLKRLAGASFSQATWNNWEQKGWVARECALSGGRIRPKTERFVRPLMSAEAAGRLSAARRAVLETLTASGAMPVSALKSVVPKAAGLVRAMAKDGQVALEERAVYRDPLGAPITPDQAPVLTVEQQRAVETMGAVLGKGYRTFLLAGVTGSGKTEVYLRLAAKALEQGVAVLVLVPEIALISQTERAFRARFGQRVALLHSGLSNGERLDQWQRILRGEAAIAIGARSAIFAPFNAIGLIIVDEEHDDSYKQEGALRYNARDLAVVRARQLGALAILGSATPSLQSAYNAQIGKFEKISLFERVDQRVMPDIFVQDLTALREERGLGRFLTPDLMAGVRDTLARGEQVLLFLNRRGFASTLVCAACGQAVRCDRCDISLTYHQKVNAYKCHYCGFSRAAVARCGRCGSSRIRRLGIGTEKLAEQIQTLFPTARVARMDRDTTRRKGALLKILKALRDRGIDILVGTQMVAKGHDYPFITLVGIICADLSLSLPDFRAGERTFQLLAQVAGRAGRGRLPGRVILQTYNPLHFSIAAARDQDYEAFYRQEIEFRKALDYPPLTRMIQVRISGRDKGRVAAYARGLGDACQKVLRARRSQAALSILGPIEAPLQRIADQYRWQLLVKGSRPGPLHHFVRQLLFGPEAVAARGDVNVSVDVDPVFLM